jgi:hypothetical protein
MSSAAYSQAPGAIGCAARPAPGRELRGRVESVFARSAHLRAQDTFLTLGGCGLPKHPFSILTPQFPTGLRMGQGFALRGPNLWLEWGPVIDLGGLRRFHPAQKIARLARPADFARALEAARETERGLPGQAGLFALVADGDHISRACGPHAPEELMRERAERLALRLGRAAAGRDWTGFILTAGDMAGLGLGLTPSGDDFLAGMLAALRFYGLSGGEITPQAVLDAVAANAAGRTSAFSGFLLRGAAKGLVAEPVCRWLCAVCAGKIRLTATATRQVLEMGSSSGADTLAGLIAGLTAATESLCA